MRDAAWFDRNWNSAKKEVRAVIAKNAREDHEDLLSKVMIRCWQCRDGFHDSQPFRNWACRIASNICIDENRYRTNQTRRLDLQVSLDTPVQGAEGFDTYRDIIQDRNPMPFTLGQYDALQRELLEFAERVLPPTYFQIVRLASTGETSREIGRKLGMPPNTVRSALAKAREKLSRAWASDAKAVAA